MYLLSHHSYIFTDNFLAGRVGLSPLRYCASLPLCINCYLGWSFNR